MERAHGVGPLVVVGVEVSPQWRADEKKFNPRFARGQPLENGVRETNLCPSVLRSEGYGSTKDADSPIRIRRTVNCILLYAPSEL
jgi:hypothetical protein